MSKIFYALVACMFVVGCDKGDKTAASTQTGAAPAAAPASCDAVVAKLASFDAKSGDAEKKLWGKMCEGMTPAQRTCIAGSKTADERDNCMKGEKVINKPLAHAPRRAAPRRWPNPSVLGPPQASPNPQRGQPQSHTHLAIASRATLMGS